MVSARGACWRQHRGNGRSGVVVCPQFAGVCRGGLRVGERDRAHRAAGVADGCFWAVICLPTRASVRRSRACRLVRGRGSGRGSMRTSRYSPACFASREPGRTSVERRGRTPLHPGCAGVAAIPDGRGVRRPFPAPASLLRRSGSGRASRVSRPAAGQTRAPRLRVPIQSAATVPGANRRRACGQPVIERAWAQAGRRATDDQPVTAPGDCGG